MSKREYTHVRLLYPEIKAMIEAGKTQREIAEYYGFKDKYVVKGLLKRERRRNAEGIPKQRGRKPAKTLAEYKYENKRLKMENELLRDFLQSIERKWGHGQSTLLSIVIGRNIQYPRCVDFLAYHEAGTMILSAG